MKAQKVLQLWGWGQIHRCSGGDDGWEKASAEQAFGLQPCCIPLLFVLTPWDLKAVSKGGWGPKSVHGDMETCG